MPHSRRIARKNKDMLAYHVISDGETGGAGVLLSHLLPALRRYGVSSAVLLPKESKLVSFLEKANITLHFVGSADTSFSVRDTHTLLRFFRRQPPDILVSHGSLSAKMAARAAGIPVIGVKHCDLPVSRPRLYRAFTDLTVATSVPCARHLLDEGVHPVACIENGFAPVGVPTKGERRAARAALGLTEDTVAVGLCGRLAPVKGQETAIRALGLLGEQGRKIRLLFLGVGEDEIRLRTLCANQWVADRVLFLGFSTETRGFYHALDVHLSCSLASETSSLSLAEGMSAALPTLASDTEGNRSRVGDGGLFFPAGDAVALSHRLRLLLHREERERWAKAALARSETLPSFLGTARAYADLFFLLTKKKGKKERNGCIFFHDMLQ